MGKLISTGFVKAKIYPYYLANIVLIKKINEKWQICIDFINLNKIYPKDSDPLPQIDQLANITSGHELLTFTDVLFGYN